ncbi:MAG: formylmethanofuran dehydrogenase subunit C [Geminicoccaceae bacterium]
MKPVRLRFIRPTTLPVDVRALTPAGLSRKSAAELARIRLLVGNRQVPMGELADVTAGDADHLIVEGAFASLDRLGHGMAGGSLEIYGDVGAYLGQGMSGGRIELFGSAGVYAAANMRGGNIHVTANVGDLLGGALPGDSVGMEEGTVLVGGDAGDRVGDRMRRGLIAVRGRLGDFAASRMIGGTIVGLHGCGADPGFAMRRGALVLGRAPVNMLATFAANGSHELPWLRLLARELAKQEPAFALPGPRVHRWTGCASVGGSGEILIGA